MFYFTRDLHQPLSQIRMSLCGSLGVEQIIFLAGINATKNTVNGLSFHPSSKVAFVAVDICTTETEKKVSLKLSDKRSLPVISQAACVAVAALLQYFLMTAFCWMLVEGIYLYLFVVKVYNISNRMNRYHVVSWGNY